MGESVAWKEGWTPPLWTRHVLPWWALHFISEHTRTCWAGMAMWKLGYEWSWWPNARCHDPYDYCGKFDEGKRFDVLPLSTRKN